MWAMESYVIFLPFPDEMLSTLGFVDLNHDVVVTASYCLRELGDCGKFQVGCSEEFSLRQQYQRM
jgi:hypothetical protein